MRKIILVGAVVVVGAAIFALWSNRDHDVPVEGTTVPQASPEPAAPLIAPEPAPAIAPEPVEPAPVEPEPVEETLDDAVEETRDAAQEAADRIEARAAEVAAEVAQEAANGAQDAANALVDAISDTADNVADGIQNLTRSAGEALSAADADRSLAQVADDAGMTTAEVEQALSVDTFDYDRAVTIIDSSDLGDPNKTLLRAVLNQARANPNLLRPALDQVRNALGM